MDQSTEKIVLLVLNKLHFDINSINNLDKKIISREIFLNEEKYKELKDYIPELKKKFKSSYLNSLQSTAEKKQSWPLLNLVRQILKKIDYKMTPKRICDGYDKEGKKKFKRFFTIEKITNNEKIIDNKLDKEDIKIVELDA